MTDRTTEIRKMAGLFNWDMEYPYQWVGSGEYGYSMNDILWSIVVEEETPDVGNFPKNIKEHFWIRRGEYDGQEWISCGVLTNGVYFFYTASCDYTGFDCQGSMRLWASKSWANIVNHAMSSEQYKLYMEQTE